MIWQPAIRASEPLLVLLVTRLPKDRIPLRGTDTDAKGNTYRCYCGDSAWLDSAYQPLGVAMLKAYVLDGGRQVKFDRLFLAWSHRDPEKTDRLIAFAKRLQAELEESGITVVVLPAHEDALRAVEASNAQSGNGSRPLRVAEVKEFRECLHGSEMECQRWRSSSHPAKG